MKYEVIPMASMILFRKEDLIDELEIRRKEGFYLPDDKTAKTEMFVVKAIGPMSIGEVLKVGIGTKCIVENYIVVGKINGETLYLAKQDSILAIIKEQQ